MTSDRDTLNDLLGQHINYFDHEHGAAVDAMLAIGWRPPAHEITTPAELAALPDYTTVCDQDSDAWERIGDVWCCAIPNMPQLPSGGLFDTTESLTVLRIPTEEATDA